MLNQSLIQRKLSQRQTKRSSRVKENIIEEEDEPSIDDIVRVVKGSKIQENKENREELLLIITNQLS